VASRAREAWGGGAFSSPQGNLPIGVSETRTCLVWGLDMSGQALWNPAWEPDKSGSRDLNRVKAERSNMSGLGAGHVQENSLEPR
jgi:hypothetical protein